MLSFLLTITPPSEQNYIEELYNEYASYMLKIAKLTLYNKDRSDYEILAEDAVQNSFIKIIKYSSRVKFESRKREKAYILAILKNECLNLIEEYKDLEDITYISDSEFIKSLNIKLNYEDVVKEIEKLDERYSIPLSLYYIGEHKVAEIAAIIGISKSAVYKRLSKARSILAGSVNGKGEVRK